MPPWSHRVLPAVSRSYPRAEGTLPMHYSPFRHSNRTPKGTFAFDLHVLATPPAFDLSQDQTLRLIIADPDNPEGPSGNQHWKLILVAEAHKGPRPGTHVNAGAKLKILYRACHEDFEWTALSTALPWNITPHGPERDICRAGAATSSRRHTLFTCQIALNEVSPGRAYHPTRVRHCNRRFYYVNMVSAGSMSFF